MNIDVQLLPKQLEFVKSQKREVLYSGAFGAGKSKSICVKLVSRACIAGAREALVRRYLTGLKGTTLKTLLEGDGDQPPVLPEGSYKHNKQTNSIKIHGGGEIVYFGLDDENKIGSYNLSGVAIDQAEELEEKHWIALRGRIRLNVIPNQIYAACNPSTPSHFLAKRFGLVDGEKCVDTGEAIVTRSADNWFLPKDYLTDLNTYTGMSKERYVEGKWVSAEGLVYDRWHREAFIKLKEGPFKRICIGQDDGYTNPAAMVLVGLDNDNNLHVLKEWYKTKQIESSVIAWAKEWNDIYQPECFVVDPAAAKLRAAMSQADLPVIEADNEVFGGIQSVQQRLTFSKGHPRLTVDPSCENLIKEFETYQWMPGKDKPVKSFDHALDALRYAIRYFDKGVVPLFSITDGTSIKMSYSEAEQPEVVETTKNWMNDESHWETIQ